MHGQRVETTPDRKADLFLGCDHRRLLDELFHSVAQPLTALSCSLGLALKRIPAHASSRKEIETALKQVESIARFTTCIRALVEAGQSVPNGQSWDHSNYLAELADELSPVARAKSVEFYLFANDPTPTRLDAQRIRQALFHLLDFALHISARRSRIFVHNRAKDGSCVVKIEVTPSARMWSMLTSRKDRESICEKEQSLQSRLPLAIARRILETAGSGFQVHTSATRLTMTFLLPLAPQEATQGLTPPLQRPA